MVAPIQFIFRHFAHDASAARELCAKCRGRRKKQAAAGEEPGAVKGACIRRLTLDFPRGGGTFSLGMIGVESTRIGLSDGTYERHAVNKARPEPPILTPALGPSLFSTDHVSSFSHQPPYQGPNIIRTANAFARGGGKNARDQLPRRSANFMMVESQIMTTRGRKFTVAGRVA